MTLLEAAVSIAQTLVRVRTDDAANPGVAAIDVAVADAVSLLEWSCNPGPDLKDLAYSELIRRYGLGGHNATY